MRALATIVAVAISARDSHALLSAVLQHGVAEALLSVLEAPQHRRCSLVVVRKCAAHCLSSA